MLHYALVSLCKDDAFYMVKIAVKGPSNGLDAWRRLTREYDPINPSSTRQLLRKIMSPKQSSLEKLRSALEEWEVDVKLYEERSGKTWDAEHKILAITDMIPTSLRVHLDLQAARCNTHELIRK